MPRGRTRPRGTLWRDRQKVEMARQANAAPNPLERFDYQPLIRTSDYFFAKFSYLFRM